MLVAQGTLKLNVVVQWGDYRGVAQDAEDGAGRVSPAETAKLVPFSWKRSPRRAELTLDLPAETKGTDGAERTGTAMPACPGDRVQVDRGNLFLAKRLGSLGVSSVRAISRDFEAGRACLRLAARRAGCAPAVPLLFPRIKADQGVSTTEGSDVHGKIERRGQRRRQRKAITRRARPAPTAGRSRNGGPASTGSRVRRGGW